MPIPGTTKLPHLDENSGALDVEEVREIEDGCARIGVHGGRTGT